MDDRNYVKRAKHDSSDLYAQVTVSLISTVFGLSALVAWLFGDETDSGDADAIDVAGQKS